MSSVPRAIYETGNGRQVVVVRYGKKSCRCRKIARGRVNRLSKGFLVKTKDLRRTKLPAYKGAVVPVKGEHLVYEGEEVAVVNGGAQNSRIRWKRGGRKTKLVPNHELKECG